jgi:hypothetical protein
VWTLTRRLFWAFMIIIIVGGLAMLGIILYGLMT